jgi:CBS domain-containing protein
MTTLVRDAMLGDPKALDARASAQEAAELLVKPDVRAVLVVDDGQQLVGLVTAESLVERVVAAGRDPRSTPLSEVAAPAELTVDADMPVEEAFRIMEEHDCERLPVTEQGRLVGVLSRSVLQRRLAEDEPPPEEPDEGYSYT